MPSSVKIFVALVTACALATLGFTLTHDGMQHVTRFAILLLFAVVASRLKVNLPGVEGNVSASLPFLLVSIVELGTAEALLVGLAATLAQCLAGRITARKLVQITFNCSTIALAVAVARETFVLCRLDLIDNVAVAIALATVAYLLTDVLMVSTVIALSEERSVLSTIGEIFTMSLPQFVIGAGVAHLIASFQPSAWQPALAALPVMYVVFWCNRRYFGTRIAPRNASLRAAAAVAGD
jgi:hypothetical protein